MGAGGSILFTIYSLINPRSQFFHFGWGLFKGYQHALFNLPQGTCVQFFEQQRSELLQLWRCEFSELSQTKEFINVQHLLSNFIFPSILCFNRRIARPCHS